MPDRSDTATSSRSRFGLHVLRLRWPELGYRYRKDEVWPLLATTDLDASLFSLREADIRFYDWDGQELWLSDARAARLADAWTDDVTAALGRAFVVTFDDERLYGGLFYNEGGAAAIQFPVIHLLGQPVSVLRIRPAMGETCDDPTPHAAAHCRAITDPRIFDWFLRCGLCGPPPLEIADSR